MAEEFENYGYKTVTLPDERSVPCIAEFEEAGKPVFLLIQVGRKSFSILGEYASYEEAYNIV